jgi:hypothetical protein
VNNPRSHLRILGALLVVVLLAAAACLPPGGPSARELAADDSFAATMPGACDVGSGGGGDARSSIGGSSYAYATRVVIAKDDEEAVLAWHRSELEGNGWTPIGWPYITMRDGRFPPHAWRRGDRVLGLGYPDRGWINRNCPDFGGRTVYELTITYQPDARFDGSPRAS